MKKILIAIGILAILGVAYWLISPLFIEKMVSETLESIPTEETPVTIAAGTFSGLAGHSGAGTATLLKIKDKYYLRFEEDFRVTNGPDLFVYFGKNDSYDPAARIAPLKGNAGSQNYEIPSTIDPKQFSEAWIWCRAFSVPFAKAILR